MSWGCRDLGGLSVDIYRRDNPAQLVIEIHASLDQLDLDALAGTDPAAARTPGRT